ncbi:M61 family metallopeptidase [Alloacidobacterium dinghuense]|uniref:M61 family metallopeptidase n=1 Tax=Alloacidobacterium dinghuense TaxID=2763107 RepID=A0A7G8BI30_9BACT|nr:M61 family metallopeptidase [Alloacidobacterium dinghuense]QNI32200.1 M61 family metallopeptidase [Alloacidobacterium dinghuense]
MKAGAVLYTFFMNRFAPALFLLALTSPAVAQKQSQPEPTSMPPAIAAPVDKQYSGPVQLSVDVTDLTDRVEKVHEEIPVEQGAKEMVLLYPQWLPGEHAPGGPISALAGIVTTVDGKRVQWVRNRVNMYAFHVPLSEGAKTVGLDFDYLSPIKASSGRIEISDAMADIEWNEIVMYPAGYFSRGISVDATLKLPKGWKYATALETASNDGDTVHFERTTLNTLVDSPLYAGLYFERIDLSPTPTDTVHLNIVADKAEDLKMTPEELQAHKNLAMEADKLYGSHHYKHYDFLLLLSEKVGGVGLEHHQSSEDGLGADYLTDWAGGVSDRDLLGHEYTHSWNGKFRRPADLWTPNFNVPMRDDLLWVYEGMTQYWGNVLTARAGMRTPEQTRDILAATAAHYAISRGRDWRPLVDTTNQPIVSQRRPVSWVSYQRPEDYYEEGMLIWLDADTKIRELTGGQKSLDDFCKKFFGVYNGSFITYQYTLEDVVKDLNAVAPYDWRGFLQERVYDLHPEVPMNGFAQGGYKLVYTDKPIEWAEKEEAKAGIVSFWTSLGFSLGSYGNKGTEPKTIGNVVWDSLAFKAGVTPGMELVSVNGTAYSAKVLRDAILAAEKDKQPIQLQFHIEDRFVTIPFAYYDGLRYPSLERVERTPDRLDDILAPSKSPLPAM